MTVERLYAEMSAAEYDHWRAFAVVDPDVFWGTMGGGGLLGGGGKGNG
jgi:hypothetical protein